MKPISLAAIVLLLVSLPARGASENPYQQVKEARFRLLKEVTMPMSDKQAETLFDSLSTHAASASIRAYVRAVDHLRLLRRRVPSDRFIRRGMWLRPYRSDLSDGHLLEVLDHATDWGITDLYIEDFWGGELAEPSPSHLFPARYPGYSLLKAYAEAAHRRGIRVHAWLHTLDFGPVYAARHPDRLVYDGWGHTSGATEKGSHAVDPGLKANREKLEKLVTELSKSGFVDGIILDYLRYPVRLKNGDVDETPDPRNFFGYNPKTLADFFKTHPADDVPAWHAYLTPPSSSSALPPEPSPDALMTWKGYLTDRLTDLIKDLRASIRGHVELESAYFPNYYFHRNDSRLQDSNRWLTYFDEVHPMCYSYYLDPNPGPYGTYDIDRELEIEENALARLATASTLPILTPALIQDPPDTPVSAPFHHRIFREQVSWLRGRMMEGQFPNIHGISFFAYGWIFGPSEARRKADDAKPASTP